MSMDYQDYTFLNGANAPFMAELFARYLENPASVDESWRQYFDALSDDVDAATTDVRGPSFAARTTKIIGATDPDAAPKKSGKKADATALSTDDVRAATLDSLRAIMIIRAYRIRGHLKAKLDPLGLEEPTPHPELDPATYGFTEADWDRPIFINNVLGLETPTLREIMDVLEGTYCGSIGVEFMHIQDPAQKAWIQERIEQIRNQTDFTPLGKRTILERLTAAESFEKFLAVKYVGTKRFGLDGGETLIPALEQILKRGSQLGLEEVVLGMPHRGRLSVLCNFMSKPFRAIISEFLGNPANPEDAGGSGDVKYHMGVSADREFDGANVHLTLNANPSHLEIVNPVVLGRVRAKQQQRQDTDHKKVMGILLHGDAAFAGQGVVAETFDFSGLRGYKTGGTIHIIVNNQIGFTTSPHYSRSSPYPTDVAKMVMAPIFHVNGDDPEASVHVARIAAEFRQEFGCDVVIDMICYRRFGHNEGDEPRFTQPLMYEKIGGHKTTRELYSNKLVEEGTLTKDEAEKILADENAYLAEEFEAGLSYKPNKADWLEGKWSGLKVASGDARRGATGVDIEELRRIGAKLCEVPEGFNLNSKLNRFIASRQKALDSGEGIDWGTGEALAFATLLTEGFMVRLSGQDSQRGTFSHRHSVYIDQKTEERYVPLNNIQDNQAHYEVIDSPLSEAGVLGFEYGYSQAEPNALTCWEAQFGDFANGAQVIMDQFVSSGEAKWLRMSGLVMLLPHGYEGQGPEHSSARIERYLQLCGEDNMQVVNCTTPANFFHVLRRQLHRDFRKPLIIFTPKSLLRHKLAVSKLEEMGSDTTFHRVLYDNESLCADKDVKRVVICSGKVYYDLYEERQKRGIKDVFFLRLEQMYPFPRKALLQELSRFPQADVVWCQEEPANMGPWTFVDRRLEDVLMELDGACKRPRYVGRREAASPATGNASRHAREQAALVDEALTVDMASKGRMAAE
ncbi:2-oxoglutarate dehydrogenase E1 component [Thalassobaculum litoreum]|uniref:2-oxoglutarate dehydrogenase E1 component n=1 Tax=Thalassobaculum litoreum DSM 18839 TaxID=1123362 RepID=A0A8G2BJW4_9PROT|nr:2-oxoglutarate dehydrogenase E1 component [Thalassobaculum litoreum]SDG11344.1 2-oxoglutarate dehydrogenase E1 component [Thalassobaculum litoreum DSM 18839]